MPEAKSVSKQQISELPRVQSDQFRSIYVNHTEAVPGVNELALTVCRIARRRAAFQLEEQAEIVFSWEHALRVRDLLNRMIQAFEDGYGKIRIEPEEQESPSAPAAAEQAG